MSAQPKRAPEADRPEPPRDVPRLRSGPRPRPATPADRPAAGEVSRLQGRIANAFTSPRNGAADAVIKLLIVAATCICLGGALARNAPLLAHLLG